MVLVAFYVLSYWVFFHRTPLRASLEPLFTFVVAISFPARHREAAEGMQREDLNEEEEEESILFRLKTCLQSLSYMVHQNRLDAEVIVVHWGVQQSQLGNQFQKISSLLQGGFDPALPRLRIIQVPRNVTKLAPPCVGKLLHERTLIGPPGGSMCSELAARNVGARRAKGKFLVLLSLDTILSSDVGSLLSSADIWRNNVIYRTQTVDLGSALRPHWNGREVYRELSLRWDRQETEEKPIIRIQTPASLREIRFETDNSNAADFMAISKYDFGRLGGFPVVGEHWAVAEIFVMIGISKGMSLGVLQPPSVTFRQHHYAAEKPHQRPHIKDVASYVGLTDFPNILPEESVAYLDLEWGFAGTCLHEHYYARHKLKGTRWACGN